VKSAEWAGIERPGWISFSIHEALRSLVDELGAVEDATFVFEADLTSGTRQRFLVAADVGLLEGRYVWPERARWSLEVRHRDWSDLSNVVLVAQAEQPAESGAIDWELRRPGHAAPLEGEVAAFIERCDDRSVTVSEETGPAEAIAEFCDAVSRRRAAHQRRD
jgi:hypothetical protein